MEIIVQILHYLVSGLEIFIAGYFFVSCLYVLVFALAGQIYQKRPQKKGKKLHSIAVMIPAYKEDEVIVDVARMAIRQQYPPSFYDVIVIADSLQPKTLDALQDLPIQVVEVAFENSTKAKALNTAIQHLQKPYDHVLVLDADNIMEPQFLQKLNDAFNNGYQVVQGHRKAKNLNTSFAILDAASEEINNHIFRKGHRALGLSSGIIGSGMAFEFNLFKSIMQPIHAVGGFDKELEFELAKKKICIEYLQDAIVLDEKIQKSTDFSTQRRRWLATQFVYLRKYFTMGWKELFSNKNINFFDKVCQMIIPPRVLLLGITVLATLMYGILNFGLNIQTQVSGYFWIVNFSLLILAFLLAFPTSFYNRDTLKALFSLPTAFVRMALLLFRLRGANTTFIHTTHGVLKN